MIPRWHVPFACANENSRLFGGRQEKVPSLIFDGIRSRDEGNRRTIAFQADALINFRGFRSGGNASIGFCHNFHEARELSAVTQLLCNLVETSLLERNG